MWMNYFSSSSIPLSCLSQSQHKSDQEIASYCVFQHPSPLPPALEHFSFQSLSEHESILDGIGLPSSFLAVLSRIPIRSSRVYQGNLPRSKDVQKILRLLLPPLLSIASADFIWHTSKSSAVGMRTQILTLKVQIFRSETTVVRCVLLLLRRFLLLLLGPNDGNLLCGFGLTITSFNSTMWGTSDTGGW